MDRAAIFGIVLMVMSLGELAAGAYFYMVGRRSSAWGTASGKIEEAKVGQQRTSDGSTMYYPHIVYSYEVDGVTYRGSRLTSGMQANLSLLDAVKAQVEPYTTMTDVLVYYDPAHPEKAVLHTGVNWLLVGGLWALGAIQFLAGVGLIIAAQLGLIKLG